LRYFLDIPKKEIPCSLAANRAAGAARVYFLGDKKTINPKITCFSVGCGFLFYHRKIVQTN
jgi:hypothetical protein